MVDLNIHVNILTSPFKFFARLLAKILLCVKISESSSNDGIPRWKHASLELLSDIFTHRSILAKDDAKNVKADVKVIATAGKVTTGDSWMCTKVINEGDSKAICHSRKI